MNIIDGQQQSKEWITLSLLYLMENKVYSDIKITEIAKKSGLVRQTIYRNYQDKDDILYEYLCHQLNMMDSEITKDQLSGEAIFIAFFNMWKEFVPNSLFQNIHAADRKIRQIIYRSLEYFVQTKYLNYFIPAQMSVGPLQHYALRSLSSMLHGILIEWSLQHYQQSPEEIGKLTYQLTDSTREYCLQGAMDKERKLNL
ncbi:TetR/AcrR family transcriptional regulator [Paenibacillus arenosi]|uniref:TetR/AcrR family transcriptional regulator n=1 Tax=Paenibacillus arenosi TaxID=2774142 RepID=A0ABR9B483_9BACL|nr:TetR/AcrR family transcriptional regulator [Paenibacillus arenosi]MBD8501174.1 TetR/AcrR family transcriptional regulator [Paenibacillus arenosi]